MHDPSPPRQHRPTIWVDADACPRPVREMLYRAADRVGLRLVLVADQPLNVPRRRNVHMLCVPRGPDAADRAIAERCSAGDLVVTADLPLAAEAVARGALALDPRGTLYTTENVQARRSVRDFMAELRGAGIETGGPSGFGARDRAAFAAQLDRWLARQPT
ncbi:MAG: UPF0178 protein [Lysobacteraceae bacterium]|nr:MAG: UPF0178 protein [Xanthomonadaceae bacterium]